MALKPPSFLSRTKRRRAIWLPGTLTHPSRSQAVAAGELTKPPPTRHVAMSEVRQLTRAFVIEIKTCVRCADSTFERP